MSKRAYDKWFKTYRTVTEVNFEGVDQWEDGDVEIAFIEGMWMGRVYACRWMLSWIIPLTPFKWPKAYTEKIKRHMVQHQNKLDKALAKRGNREEIGGADHEAYDEKLKKNIRRRPPSMTKEVALCKFHAMPQKKKIIVMDKAMNYMENHEGHHKDYAIACIVAQDMKMELR